MIRQQGFFPVIWVSREDIEGEYAEAQQLTDQQVEEVASLMGEYITSMDYWEALSLACEKVGLVNEWLNIIIHASLKKLGVLRSLYTL